MNQTNKEIEPVKLNGKLQKLYAAMPEAGIIFTSEEVKTFSEGYSSPSGIGTSMTSLRRMGLVSSPDGAGIIKGNARTWVKHNLLNPLNPPQDDFIRRKNMQPKTPEISFNGVTDQIDEIMRSLIVLEATISDLKIKHDTDVADGVKAKLKEMIKNS